VRHKLAMVAAAAAGLALLAAAALDVLARSLS
jgi:hypothetical protein